MEAFSIDALQLLRFAYTYVICALLTTDRYVYVIHRRIFFTGVQPIPATRGTAPFPGWGGRGSASDAPRGSSRCTPSPNAPNATWSSLYATRYVCTYMFISLVRGYLASCAFER